MSLNKRIESLEKLATSGLGNFHVIFPEDDESDEKAMQKYCKENELSIEQLKHVIYVKYDDAGLL